VKQPRQNPSKIESIGLIGVILILLALAGAAILAGLTGA